LLTSLAHCGHCEGIPSRDGRKRSWRMYGIGRGTAYRCYRYQTYGVCGGKSVKVSTLDALIKQAVMDNFTFTSEVRAAAAESIKEELGRRRSVAAKQREELLRSRSKHQERRVLHARQMLGDIGTLIDPEVFRSLDAQDVEAIRLIDAELKNAPQEEPAEDVGPLLKTLASITWADLAFEDWREVLSALIDRVVVWSLDRYEVIWNEEADVVRVAMKGVRV
jgi:hypothetical protein